MSGATQRVARGPDTGLLGGLLDFFRCARSSTETLAAPLAPEDMVAQSMPDASPTKWHLAHTTWFFEKLVLEPRLRNYKPFSDDFYYLYNSYYHSLGERHPRVARGLITRPSLAKVMEYRSAITERVAELLMEEGGGSIAPMVELGIHHEMQHQELLLMDILNLFAANPTAPAYRKGRGGSASLSSAPSPLKWRPFRGGLCRIGASGERFAYDCELLRHQVFIGDFKLADRPVNNGEWRQFIRDGGYEDSRFWLSDGWDWRCREEIVAPLYWREGDTAQFTLNGLVELEDSAPVCHISYYEACAFAKYADCRLPTEAEWEVAAVSARPDEVADGDNFIEKGVLAPQAPFVGDCGGFSGNLWEWSGSAFLPYPGYRPPPSALGEYNGKFMSSQMVMRGGSFATPGAHYRHSYRNFFYPRMRWQFGGVRLAKDS